MPFSTIDHAADRLIPHTPLLSSTWPMVTLNTFSQDGPCTTARPSRPIFQVQRCMIQGISMQCLKQETLSRGYLVTEP